ncbi:MAG: enoyl-CoA hydratase/isomerase family protein [Mycobacteriaceae bacterium]|nr:enoyl-CoA hydratase/isomerase family protein [Mycobacteriaceae bacterium]
MAGPAVILERDQHILTITLNRPAKRNAFNPEVLCRLADAWDLLDDDPELRVAIMTGADGNFSAGADLDRLVGALIAGEPPQNEYEERVRSDFSLIYKGFLKDHYVKKPIIAAVEGSDPLHRRDGDADRRHADFRAAGLRGRPGWTRDRCRGCAGPGARDSAAGGGQRPAGRPEHQSLGDRESGKD